METAMVIKDQIFYLIGIKGTGMAALAELIKRSGGVVTGSDVDEVFYTDTVLNDLGIPFHKGFSEQNIPDNAQWIIRSAAYPEDHIEVKAAIDMGYKILTYTQALGELSSQSYSAAIAGVHGKTTTTALAGTALKETSLPFSALVGSAVSNFGGRSTHVQGEKYFIAETCEYRRHFLDFSPRIILLTSVEADHLDYFTGYDDIRNAFLEFIEKLPENGTLIYCADDKGAKETVEKAISLRSDIKLIPYGFTAEGDFKISSHIHENGRNEFILKGIEGKIELGMPGEHTALNAAGVMALSRELLLNESLWDEKALNQVKRGLKAFTGSKRRSEIVDKIDDILIMDDYGHHPTAISKTIRALKEFYPERRLIVDFMSHTYSRTQSLFKEFASCLNDADMVILHKIYSSAREKPVPGITGESLFNAVKQNRQNVYYFEEINEALPFCLETIKSGDLFLTMGAGNNWTLGTRIAENLRRS